MRKVQKRRSVEGRFDGGEVSSDGRLILMREADRRLGLIKSVARRIGDKRQQGEVRHGAVTLLRQRVMALCAGREDLNDAQTLQHDPTHQLAAGGEALGASRNRFYGPTGPNRPLGGVSP